MSISNDKYPLTNYTNFYHDSYTAINTISLPPFYLNFKKEKNVLFIYVDNRTMTGIHVISTCNAEYQKLS